MDCCVVGAKESAGEVVVHARTVFRPCNNVMGCWEPRVMALTPIYRQSLLCQCSHHT